MTHLDRATAVVALLLAAPPALAGGDPEPIVLTSSTRSISMSTSIDDGVTIEGDSFFDSSTTLMDWTISHSLDTMHAGGTADCSASHMSSTSPDSFSIAFTCTAGSSNPGSLPFATAFATTNFTLDFTVVETTVFAVDAQSQSEFISFDAFSQASYQLLEVSGCEVGENCIIMDFFACGFLVKLVPGTYQLTAGCLAGSSQAGVAGDTEVTGSLDLTFTRVEPTEFFVDPSQSLFAVDVFVPGVGTQHVETPAQGFITAAFSECTEFGTCQVLLVDGDLTAVDPEMTINTPLGDIVVSVDTVSLVESGGPIGLQPGAVCGYPDGCCGTPSSAFVHTAGAIGGIPYSQDLDLCLGLGACDLVILCGGGPCDCASNCPGVAASAFGPSSGLQLVIPGIEYTTEIDLGLGKLNPSATFSGEITGETPPAPCPGDIIGDGVIDVLDLIELLLCFGQPAAPPCDAGQDVNGDGIVNVLDLIEFLLAFGTTCP